MRATKNEEFMLEPRTNQKLDDASQKPSLAGSSVAIHKVNVSLNSHTQHNGSNFSIAAHLFRRRASDRRQEHKKTILNDVSTTMLPGTLTAIVGASGSGKTTLLDTLAGRITMDDLTLSGTLSLDGTTHDINNDRVSTQYAGYVMQDDVLIASLTVRETLTYACKLHSFCPPENIHQVVQSAIVELGLQSCADTRVGDHSHRGCSGGEKRRTSVAVQLLANRPILFLDEPTTGLDAASALDLIKTLERLAENGRTVIM